MKKNCEDTEAKFGMMELLFEGQGKKDFMRFKKTVTKALLASNNTGSIATPRGITEDSFQISINSQLFTKSMTKVLEYMEMLEVLEATDKQPSTNKNNKNKAEGQTPVNLGLKEGTVSKYHKPFPEAKNYEDTNKRELEKYIN